MITDDIKAVYNRGKWALIIRGLFGIALGIFIMARPFDSVAALALVIAIWALGDGIVNIVHSFDLRGVVQHWWVMLLSGVVSVLFGVAALYYYPALSLSFAVIWTALWLITAGILGIYASVQEKRAELSWGWTMAFGVIALAGGVLAVMYPQITLAGLISLIAAFGIVGGVAMLVGAYKLQAFAGDVTHAMRGPATSSR